MVGFGHRWWHKYRNCRSKKKNSSQGQSSNREDNQTLTIKHLADTYRALLLSEMLPVQFVGECMKFDQEIVPDGLCDEQGDLGEGDELTCRTIGVLKRLAAAKTADEQEARTMARRQHQLALIWLDGHNCGQIKLGQLESALAQLRQISVLSRVEAEATWVDQNNMRGVEVQMPNEGDREWENW